MSPTTTSKYDSNSLPQLLYEVAMIESLHTTARIETSPHHFTIINVNNAPRIKRYDTLVRTRHIPSCMFVDHVCGSCLRIMFVDPGGGSYLLLSSISLYFLFHSTSFNSKMSGLHQFQGSSKMALVYPQGPIYYHL
jgi:hypothetical protein